MAKLIALPLLIISIAVNISILLLSSCNRNQQAARTVKHTQHNLLKSFHDKNKKKLRMTCFLQKQSHKRSKETPIVNAHTCPPYQELRSPMQKNRLNPSYR
jgi:hypothetical protein